MTGSYRQIMTLIHKKNGYHQSTPSRAAVTMIPTKPCFVPQCCPLDTKNAAQQV